MSPHAVRVENDSIRIKKELLGFDVTKNAFLPHAKPLKMLPDSYYEPWELLAHHLPQLIADHRISDAVDRIPVLSTCRLKTPAEWRRSFSILAYLTHAYVWGGEQPREILPPQIAIPFLEVSAHLELPPVLAYAGANLWNFDSSSDDFSDLESLIVLTSFTGTESEAWFLLVSTAMEARAGRTIEIIMTALHAVKTRDYETISCALEELRTCIDQVAVLLDRMYERCDPMIFYHQIRPFYAGSKGMEESGLPNGVFYDEGDGKGEWRHLRGGSNGQSSLIQLFDIVLGVEHGSHGNKTPLKSGERTFQEEVRDYMPGPHRRFLIHAARMGSIRELALAEATTPEQTNLRERYVAATKSLTEFRNRHIQIVTRYIILPSKQPWHGGREKNLASVSTKGEGELTGTGGTALIPFLKQTRDDTSAAAKLEKVAS